MASGWPSEQIPNHPFIDLTLQLEIYSLSEIGNYRYVISKSCLSYLTHIRNENWLTVLVSLAFIIDNTLKF